MAVLLLTSAAGAPGVTSTALGMALWWPREVVLVDADPHPCHAVEAGYLGGRGSTGEGLGELARVHRRGGDLTAALWARLVELPQPGDLRPGRTGSPEREPQEAVHYLPGFGHPAQPALFQTVWPALAASFAELGQAGIDVIVDLGRMPWGMAGSRTAGGGVPAELAARAAVLAVVARAGLRSLAGLSLHREQLDAAAQATTAHLGLVLIGPGRPYSAKEVRGQFGIPVLAEIAEDARAAAVLSDGAGLSSGSLPRGWGRGRYVSSLRHAASVLHRQMARQAGIAEPELEAGEGVGVSAEPGPEVEGRAP